MDTVAVLGVVFLLPEQVHIRRLLLAHRIRVLRIYARVGASSPDAYSRPYSFQILQRCRVLQLYHQMLLAITQCVVASAFATFFPLKHSSNEDNLLSMQFY